MNPSECFVVMPFGSKPFPDASGRLYDFDKVYRVIIQRAIREADMTPVRADERVSSAIVNSEMFRDLRHPNATTVRPARTIPKWIPTLYWRTRNVTGASPDCDSGTGNSSRTPVISTGQSAPSMTQCYGIAVHVSWVSSSIQGFSRRRDSSFSCYCARGTAMLNGLIMKDTEMLSLRWGPSMATMPRVGLTWDGFSPSRWLT
jgi:hypothetical protein